MEDSKVLTQDVTVKQKYYFPSNILLNKFYGGISGHHYQERILERVSTSGRLNFNQQ
jgi:hypothetical protein